MSRTDGLQWALVIGTALFSFNCAIESIEDENEAAFGRDGVSLAMTLEPVDFGYGYNRYIFEPTAAWSTTLGELASSTDDVLVVCSWGYRPCEIRDHGLEFTTTKGWHCNGDFECTKGDERIQLNLRTQFYNESQPIRVTFDSKPACVPETNEEICNKTTHRIFDGRDRCGIHRWEYCPDNEENERTRRGN